MFKAIRNAMVINSAMRPLLIKLGESQSSPPGMNADEYSKKMYVRRIKEPYAMGYLDGYINAVAVDLVNNGKVSCDIDHAKSMALSSIDNYVVCCDKNSDDYRTGYSHGGRGYHDANQYGHKALVPIRSYLRSGVIREPIG